MEGDLITAEHVARAVLRSGDPYEEPFLPVLGERLLVALVTGLFTLDQFDAISKAVSSVGDEFMISCVAGAADDQLHLKFWPERPLTDVEIIKVGDYASYKRTALAESCLLLSPSRTWAVINSEDDFAIFAGGKEFIAELRAHYPLWPPGDPGGTPVDQQWVLFKQNAENDWKDPAPPARVLKHVGNPERR